MRRAGVFIGVNRTGTLPVLKDAVASAMRMAGDWAQRQGFDVIATITDDGGATVDIDRISTTIDGILAPGNIDQLVVYFSGHGVNIRYGEYWLLTKAPKNTNEAVNVAGSVELARYCGVPHVVFISDACRTAASGIQAQWVTGSEVIPNVGIAGPEFPVDQFFACGLGRAAHEVLDPTTTAKEFSAVYTAELLPALQGKVADLNDEEVESGRRIQYVRPRPLGDYLPQAISNRIQGLHLQTQLIQEPVARITSNPMAWISRIDAGPADPSTGLDDSSLVRMSRSSATARHLDAGAAAAPIRMTTRESVSESLLASALDEGPSGLGRSLATARGSRDAGIESVIRVVETTAPQFGPTHQETQCGFKIRGALFREVFAKNATALLRNVPGDVVQVHGINGRGASVVLRFDSGGGAVLPAIPEFMTALTVENGELVDVAYEPSDNTWRWHEYLKHADEVRALRSVAAASTTNGVFRLEGHKGPELARRMQYAKSIDPALAVYAAYAYHDLRRRERLQEMVRYMRQDLGACLFDLAMLAREADLGSPRGRETVFSFAPLLSQGWALLSALRVALPRRLEKLNRNLVPSTWTMFDDEGLDRIKDALQSGDIR